MLRHEEAIAAFSYDANTGLLTWKINPSPNVNSGQIAGCIRDDGYIRVGIKRRRYFAHKVIWLWMTGKWPNNEIDHINLVKGDNRWANLREATRSQNLGNQPIHSNNKCGVKGVSWAPRQQKWKAKIAKDGASIHLGYFENLNEASIAYAVASKAYFKEFARQ